MEKYPGKYLSCTGYALDADGDDTWRRHSWLLDGAGRIIETTCNRDKYFGYITID